MTARPMRPRALWLCFLACLFTGMAWALTPVPQLRQRVTDLTGSLNPETLQALETRLATFEATRGSQIAVLVVPSTGEEDIAAYAIRVVEQWRLGRQGIDDGVLLLVAKNDRRLRIEVGYGMEGAIPDAAAKRIIAETIAPHLRQGDFVGGITAGVEQLMGLIRGEPLPAPRPGDGSQARQEGDTFGLVVAGLVGASVLTSLLGRPWGGLLAGLGTGIALWPKLWPAIWGGVLVFFVGLLLRRRSGGWTSGTGGFSNGFSGGGFSSGGFSGGGGGFGGGGASGSW